VSAIFLPSRWRHQPQGAVEVDQSHPIGAKVRWAYTPWIGRTSVTPGKIRDVTASLTADPALQTTPSGIGTRLLADSSTTRVTFSTSGLSDYGGSMFLFVENFDFRSTSNGLYVGMAGTAAGDGLQISSEASGRYPALRLYSSNDRYAATSLSVQEGRNKIGVSQVDSQNVRFNVDGTYETSSIASTYTMGWPAYLKFSKAHGTVLLFLRADYLSAAEMNALMDEPWAIFRAPSHHIWFDLGASGGPAVYTLDAQPLAVGASPQPGSPLAQRRLSADSTSITLSGADAGLNKIGSYSVEAQPVSLSLVAQTAGLAVVRRLSADPITVTLTAAAASGYAQRRLAADAGAVAITGLDAELHRSGYYPLEASSAAASILLADAGLVVNRLGQSVRSTGGGGSGGGQLWRQMGEEIEEEMHALLRDPEPIVAHPVDASPLKEAIVATLPEQQGAEETFAEALREYKLAQAELMRRRRERRKRILLLS